MPLLPKYVSTVDSGNFAAALLTLVSGAARARRVQQDATTTAGRSRAARMIALADARQRLLRRNAFRLPLRQEAAACSRSATGSPISIGGARLDTSFYDLLASEARLASFIAIAKGDVPELHWFHLGRLITSVRGSPVLLSWSATMFEYLMPLLVMRSFPETLLDESCRMAVRRQIDYGLDARHAVGHLRVGLHRRRSRRQLSVQGVRRPRPRPEARPRRRAGHRAVRDGAGRA